MVATNAMLILHTNARTLTERVDNEVFPSDELLAHDRYLNHKHRWLHAQVEYVGVSEWWVSQ